jgi:hypothetical protein
LTASAAAENARVMQNPALPIPLGAWFLRFAGTGLVVYAVSVTVVSAFPKRRSGRCFSIRSSGLLGIDENHAIEVAELLAYFHSLQRRLDLSVVLVHRKRKTLRAELAKGFAVPVHAFGDSNLYLRRSGLRLSVFGTHRDECGHDASRGRRGATRRWATGPPGASACSSGQARTADAREAP